MILGFKIKNSSIEDRYKAICKAARDFSVVSFGLSCFKITRDSLSASNSSIKVTYKAYNLLTVPSSSFSIEPQSINFLISHGFDMNDLFLKGIKYYKGNDKVFIKIASILFYTFYCPIIASNS
jgi:target of EGR1 protein 1